MHRRQTIPAFAAALSAFAVGAPGASAATEQVQESISQNWAGYVVGSNGQSGFSSVSGSWVEPTASCTSDDGHSAFWVGLGGSGQQSQALEQVGTEADCTATGQATHFAWYELVPAAPVRLGLTISPGDHISARVTVNGSNVTVSLTNATTGQSATDTLQMNDPDTSSAEWIAEAPSACDGSLQSCTPLDLTDFSTVTFTNATATAGGHTGTIGDPDWTPSAVALGSQTGGAGAQPTSTNGNGSSFSVSYTSANASANDSGGGDPGNGYGYGGGYGGGGYGGGGYGGGYAGGGYYPGGGGYYGY
jgi:hypothetical protein